MSEALKLADKLNSLCVAEFAWPTLNEAATELRRLNAEKDALHLELHTERASAIAWEAQAKDSAREVRRLTAEIERLSEENHALNEDCIHYIAERNNLRDICIKQQEVLKVSLEALEELWLLGDAAAMITNPAITKIKEVLV